MIFDFDVPDGDTQPDIIATYNGCKIMEIGGNIRPKSDAELFVFKVKIQEHICKVVAESSDVEEIKKLISKIQCLRGKDYQKICLSLSEFCQVQLHKCRDSYFYKKKLWLDFTSK